MVLQRSGHTLKNLTLLSKAHATLNTSRSLRSQSELYL